MYRTHDNPDRERIEALSVFLNAVGFNIPQGGDLASPIIINQIIESAKGTTLEDLVSTEMLRSMAKAKYSTSNPKHFGLGFSYYCHFTSPIRRYPDLIAHRLFNHYLHGKSIKSDEWSQYEAIAQIASEREIEVMDAERESIKLKQVEYLTSRIGEVFDGIISGMSESGFFAEELTTKANGLIRFRTLTDDTYKVDRKKYAAIGSTTGKTYQLGDAVKIKVVKTDTDTKQVDFELVS
jgi:ribonuclease R